MSASQEECVAAFPRQPVCQDRVYARVLAWAAYQGALPLPPDTSTAPDKALVQQRIVAERFPLTGQQAVQGISAYLLEIPNITNDIRDHLNAYNDEATETGLAGEIDTSLATAMPKYCAAVVSDAEVAAWCDSHGYPRPDGLTGFLPPAPGP